ncbi:andropin [Drosophila simulans]|uniref:Andropin n=1 Tax=Drosophila simulans TaxID=7240 RepID=B4R1J7_DROSI|nr:andropin [Drosophila simulans]
MTIFNLYIFDKFGTLLHYAEWNRTKKSGITREEENAIHKAAQAGIGIAKPIENMILPKSTK